MKLKKPKVLKRRGFLRPISSGANETTFHSQCEIEEDVLSWGKNKGKKSYAIFASFKIRDCSRSIGLDLYSDTDKVFQENLKAIDKLIGEAEQVRGAMVEANNYLLARKKQV